MEKDARDLELRHFRAADERADGALAVERFVKRHLVLAHIQRSEVRHRALHLREDHVQAGDFFADHGRLIEAADSFHDHSRRIDRQHDALVHQLVGGVAEAEAPLFPTEERIDDLQRLILDAPPEILRRDGAHLHEQLAVAGGGGDAAFRFFVLLLGDLAVAQQEHAEGVLGRVGGGEDDLAVFPVDGALQLFVDQPQLPGAADDGKETEDVRQLNAREIALEDVILRHVGPAATVTNKRRSGKDLFGVGSSSAQSAEKLFIRR